MSRRPIRALFLATGAAIGVMYPFITVILIGRGFSVLAVGVVNGISALAFTLAVPAWGHLADVRLGRPRALQIATAGAAVALAVTMTPIAPIVVAACFVAFAIFQSAFAPLGDALAVNAVADPRRDYAAIRVLASGSFAASTVGAGFLYDRIGYGLAPLIFAACAAVAIAAARLVPDAPRTNPTPVAGDEPGRPGGRLSSISLGSVGVAFSVAPRLPAALLAIGLIHIGILGGFTFLAVRLRELGASPSMIGLSSGISGIAEMPGFLLAAVAVRRLDVRSVFALGTLLYCACFTAWAVIDVPALLLATRIATGFAIAAVSIAAVLTIATLLPDRLQATGQTLYQAIAFGLAAILANLAGGVVYSGLGPTALFGSFALLALCAMVVGWLALPRRGLRTVL